MTPEEAVEKLKWIAQGHDAESDHYDADMVLLELVPKEVAEAWEKVHKWYS
jgi:hypothetical protein